MFIPRGFKAALIIFFGALALLLSFACKKDSPTGSDNNSPIAPSSPYPINGAENIGVTPNLSWECSDPDGDPLTYDIYLGKTSNPQIVAQYWPNRIYRHSNALERGESYYWKIVARDFNDNETEGPLWHFTTHTNQPPAIPSNPLPADDAERVSSEITLSWQCSDPEGDSIYYDIYFDTLSPPSLYTEHHASLSYSLPETLSNFTNYYWQIVAIDTFTNETTGPIWSFTTEKEPGIYYVQQITTSGTAFDLFVIRDELYIVEGSAGLEIYDISAPTIPLELGVFPYFECDFEDVIVEGNHAYIADANNGIHILDISNPFQPIADALVDLPLAARGLELAGNKLYVACDISGLYVIDVAFAGMPEIVGHLPFGSSPAQCVSVIDNFAIMGCLAEGINTVDISNPDSLESINQYGTPGQAEKIVMEYTGGHRYAFVADGSGGCLIVNYDIVTSPLLYTYRNFGNYVYDVATDDNYAYLAISTSGVYVVRKDNPHITIGEYNTLGQARAIHPAGRYLFVADGSRGVQILEFVE